MENKIIKKLIILGAIVFSLALANNAYAANYALPNNSAVYHYDPYSSSVDNQGYSQYSYYQESGYNTNSNPTNPNPINPAVNSVNPYYINQVYPQPQPQPQYAYYQQSGYSTYNVIPSTVTTKPNVVNNYYYKTAPATTAKTSTTSTTKTSDTSNTNANADSGYNYSNGNNGLGASAYGNDIAALSLRGSGSFMPSSVWQWILVIVLILAIIIISRILIKKPTLEMQESHVAHAH